MIFEKIFSSGADSWGKSLPDGRNSICKHPKARASLEARGPGTGWEEEEEEVRSVLQTCLTSEWYTDRHRERGQGFASESFLEETSTVNSLWRSIWSSFCSFQNISGKKNLSEGADMGRGKLGTHPRKSVQNRGWGRGGAGDVGLGV